MNEILPSLIYIAGMVVAMQLADRAGYQRGRREGWREARQKFEANDLSAEERVRRHEMAVYGVMTTTLSAGGREVGTATSVVNLN